MCRHQPLRTIAHCASDQFGGSTSTSTVGRRRSLSAGSAPRISKKHCFPALSNNPLRSDPFASRTAVIPGCPTQQHRKDPDSCMPMRDLSFDPLERKQTQTPKPALTWRHSGLTPLIEPTTHENTRRDIHWQPQRMFCDSCGSLHSESQYDEEADSGYIRIRLLYLGIECHRFGCSFGCPYENCDRKSG